MAQGKRNAPALRHPFRPSVRPACRAFRDLRVKRQRSSRVSPTSDGQEKRKPMKLIINADDFGMSHEVNTAIRDSFRQGLISSTTLMANMEGFDPKSRLIAS